MKKISVLVLLLANIFFAVAQSTPKREMRSAWLATVYRLDWPNNAIQSTGHVAGINMQKADLIEILDKMKAMNANSVFFQVRSRCDAMYDSSFEPWSVDLVRERGLDPGYDPLQFAIEEAHKRGLELHAWINPYRFESVAGQWAGKAGDYSTTNPDWVLKVGNSTILDPGNPQVRERIVNIVDEIVTKYDVDGIVFDDYFYLQGITTEDAESAKTKPIEMPIGDWRRSNVDKMVADVHAKIKSIKKHVQFGVSPAGIWTNKKDAAAKYGVTLPAITSGGYAYDGIYCDPLAWMKAKTVDYISPQIYWPTTHGSSNYTALSEWWSDVSNQFDVQFYSSHSVSDVTGVPRMLSTKIGGDMVPNAGLSGLEQQMFAQKNLIQTRATQASDYLLQVENNRTFDRNGAPGSVFYSVNVLLYTARFSDYLRDNVFQSKAIRPALWSPASAEEFVTDIKLSGKVLTWNYTGAYPRFSVYAIPNTELGKVGNFAKSNYLVDIVYSPTFAIPADKPASDYTYAVCVLDRFNNEFAPKVIGDETLKTGAATSLVFPTNGAATTLPHDLKWNAQSDAEFYILEVATDASFNSIVYKRELSETSMSSLDLRMLETAQTYYWRVITRRVSTKDAVSAVSSFTPTRFSITYPANGATELVVTPTIKWNDASAGTIFKLEIAKEPNFATSSVVLTENVSNTEFTVPSDILEYNSTYYVRTSFSLNSATIMSDVVQFATKVMVPPVPVFISPADNADILATDLDVSWVGSPFASGYRIDMHKKETFLPVRDLISNVTNAFVYETNFSALETGVYYIRVRANYGQTNTAWSDVRKVNFTYGVSIDEERMDDLGCYVYSTGNEKYLVINSDTEAIASASIYNLSGAKVADLLRSYSLDGGKSEFLIPSNNLLAKGVYLIKVNVNSKVYSIKLVN